MLRAISPNTVDVVLFDRTILSLFSKKNNPSSHNGHIIFYFGKNVFMKGIVFFVTKRYNKFRKVSREKRIPFEVNMNSFYSGSNIRYLEQIVHDVT